MRVLAACEMSGRVRDAFRRQGHEAYSCDILPNPSPYHIQRDVMEILDDAWDIMIAFPPCTYISNIGNRWYRGTQAESDALDFVWDLMNADIPKICIENPVGQISTQIGKPDQIIDPFMFGDPYYKKTCLWLDGLPALRWSRKTMAQPPYMRWVNNGKNHFGLHKTPSVRSLTFPGIANAMAEQWG